jgi:hypothetical protein
LNNPDSDKNGTAADGPGLREQTKNMSPREFRDFCLKIAEETAERHGLTIDGRPDSPEKGENRG